MHSFLHQIIYCAYTMFPALATWQGHNSEFILWFFEVYLHWERQTKSTQRKKINRKKVDVQTWTREFQEETSDYAKGWGCGEHVMIWDQDWYDSIDHGVGRWVRLERQAENRVPRAVLLVRILFHHRNPAREVKWGALVWQSLGMGRTGHGPRETGPKVKDIILPRWNFLM